MRYLSVLEILDLHCRLLKQSGGGRGIRDQNALASAAARPRTTFGERELYETAEAKAAALAFSIVNNHPFVDGNKRVAHAAMEVFLVLNGKEIEASVDAQEKVMLDLAAGHLDLKGFTAWLSDNVVKIYGDE